MQRHAVEAGANRQPQWREQKTPHCLSRAPPPFPLHPRAVTFSSHPSSPSQSQGLLGEFVDFIKEKKVVPYEDLAATFNLKTQEAINRVQALERMGRITGVEDDRGKFIYISSEVRRCSRGRARTAAPRRPAPSPLVCNASTPALRRPVHGRSSSRLPSSSASAAACRWRSSQKTATTSSLWRRRRSAASSFARLLARAL